MNGTITNGFEQNRTDFKGKTQLYVYERIQFLEEQRQPSLGIVFPFIEKYHIDNRS